MMDVRFAYDVLFGRTDTVNLNYAFGQIEADRGKIHVGGFYLLVIA